MRFIDLQTQQKIIEVSLQKRIQKVLGHGKYIMGPEVKELEEKLAEYCGVRYGISCSSGTDALLMALMAYGVGPGDAIFTSPFSFIAAAEVIFLLGATPVFVDIDPKTFNIDPERLNETIDNLKTKKNGSEMPDRLKAKGIITVDLFGLPADYDAINNIAGKNDLFVLEDAAQSFGGSYKDKKTGNLADMAAVSFFPAKPLGCYGDGGAVFLNNSEMSDRIKSIRVHGKGTEKNDNVRVGLNARMDTLQAAILLAKMEIFSDELKKRQQIATRYSGGLKDVVDVPFVPEDCTSAWAQYSILSSNKEKIMGALKKADVPVGVYYPKPLHLQGAFSKLNYKQGQFPVSEETSDKIFSLPMHPYLDEKSQETIISIIKESA